MVIYFSSLGYQHTYSKKLISYIRGKISSYMKESLYKNINTDLVENLKKTPHTIFVKRLKSIHNPEKLVKKFP